MSKVLEEMKTRRSIRKFKPDMIPQDILDRIIEAGTYAANGRGAQNTIIIQVTNKEIRDEIAKRNADIMGSNTDPFYGAPDRKSTRLNSSHPLSSRMPSSA